MFWVDILKCIIVDKGGGFWIRVMFRVFWIVWWSVRDFIFIEFRYYIL